MRSIVLNPGENDPRLAYADWLDEEATTELEADRAEFIRVSIDLATRSFCRDCRDTGTVIKSLEDGRIVHTRDGRTAPVVGVEVRPCPCGITDARARHDQLLEKKHPCEPKYWMTGYADRIRGPILAPAREIWAEGLAGYIGSVRPGMYDYRRGFVGHVAATIEHFMMHAGHIADCVPLESVSLCNVSPVLTGEQGWNSRNGLVTTAPYLGFGWVDYTRTAPGEYVRDFSYAYPDVIPELLWDDVEQLRDKDVAESGADSLKWLSWACVSYAANRSAVPGRKFWCPRPPAALWYPPSLGRNQYDMLVRASGGLRVPGMARVKSDYAYEGIERARSRTDTPRIDPFS